MQDIFLRMLPIKRRFHCQIPFTEQEDSIWLPTNWQSKPLQKLPQFSPQMINRFIMHCAWKLSKHKHSQLSQSPVSLTSLILHSFFKNSPSNCHLFTSRYTQTIATHIDWHKCLSFQANTMSLHALSWAKRRTFTWGIDFKQNHNRKDFHFEHHHPATVDCICCLEGCIWLIR